jgi:hypothetical protein
LGPYHQSSHVGDEFVIANLSKGFRRLNYSYEELELIGSYNRRFNDLFVEDVRFYAGGGWMFDTDSHFKTGKLQWGIALRTEPVTGSAGEKTTEKLEQFIGKSTQLIVVMGADFKQFEEQSWNINSNVVFGINGSVP